MTIGEREFEERWIYDEDLNVFVILGKDFGRDATKASAYKVTWENSKRANFSNGSETFELSREKELTLDKTALNTLLVGRWQLKSLNGIDHSAETGGYQFKMKLKADGILEKVEAGELQKGKWSLSEDNKELTLSDNRSGDELMQLALKDKKTISLTSKRGHVFVFEKLIKGKDGQKLEKSLVGKWKNETNGLLVFDAKGGVEMFENDILDKTFRWEVDADGDFLMLSPKEGPPIYMPFNIVNKNTLNLIDLQVLTYTRQE